MFEQGLTPKKFVELRNYERIAYYVEDGRVRLYAQLGGENYMPVRSIPLMLVGVDEAIEDFERDWM